jgi:zinc protease
LDELLAVVLLAEVLTDGDASRLQRRLVHQDRLVTGVEAYVGEFGDPFDERDPTAMTISAHYPSTTKLDAVLRTVDEELAKIADDGLARGELERVRTRLLSVLVRDLDAVLSRTLEFAKYELVHGRAEQIFELPERLAAVTSADVQRAASTFRPDNRAVLEVVAGGAE